MKRQNVEERLAEINEKMYRSWGLGLGCLAHLQTEVKAHLRAYGDQRAAEEREAIVEIIAGYPWQNYALAEAIRARGEK